MLKNKKIKILILILIIILIILFDFNFIKRKNVYTPPIGNSYGDTPLSPPLLPTGRMDEKVRGLISLEIDGLKYQSEIIGETNIADFMEKLKNERKINFIEKNYTGMGKFIESINGIKNGEKNWIYYVNGQKANIGISNYKIKQGDIVSWKYEKSY